MAIPDRQDFNSDDEVFFQSEPLTIRLHNLVRNYPKGPGIFLEFIQNADDAEATNLKIVLDHRTHPTHDLPEANMREIQGPAILVYNDRPFSPTDLRGIQNISQSVKSKESSKTGRFGLGFNTAYNVTDYPTFVTGRGFYIFDPHCNVAWGDGRRDPGRKLLLDKTWRSGRDLLLPFALDKFGFAAEQDELNATIFRLPIRTYTQALVSEIRAEPFTAEDFHDIVEKLSQLGPELMIFLKHLLKIEIYEIHPDHETASPLVSIVTENSDEVVAQRSILNKIAQSDANQLLQDLQSLDVDLPRISYQHRIAQYISGSLVLEETWRVISGLYAGPNGELLLAAESMLKHGERAVPWAGAAARITSSGKPTSVIGKAYCGLPLLSLLDKSALPIHINGFFDLDDSRQSLTTGELSGFDANRVQWNKLLIQHGVALAYAELIETLAKDIGEDELQTYYRYWPNNEAHLPGPLGRLPNNVYQQLASRKVIPTASQEHWCSIDEVQVIPKGGEALNEPLSKAGYPIPTPPLPNHITNGFQQVPVTVHRLTPKSVRDFFRISSDINQPVSAINVRGISREHEIANLLKYCLSDDPINDLAGVPFLILNDDYLHTVGFVPCGYALWGSSLAEREILSELPGLFVRTQFEKDVDFSERIGRKDYSKARLHSTTPGYIIANLQHTAGATDGGDPKGWYPTDEQPSIDWLIKVYRYLATVTPDKLMPARDQLIKIPLIPDQFSRLWPMGWRLTPLLMHGEEHMRLAEAMTKLGVPIVSGPKALIEAIEAFSKAYPTLICRPDACDVVNRLADSTEVWSHAELWPDESVCRDVLNFLTSTPSLTTLRQHPDVCGRLKKLPIFLGLNGSSTDLSVPVYIPTGGYEPPRVAGDICLLDTGPNGQWRTLLEMLDVPELDQPRVILDILLPQYVNMDSQHRKEALKWVRDNLRNAEAKLENLDKVSEAKELRKQVMTAHLIRCTDGQYRPILHCYDPYERTIRRVLRERAFIPDMRVYADTRQSWLEFFDLLDIQKTPRAQDLLDYINNLCAQATQQGADTIANQITSLFNLHCQALESVK